MADNSKILLGLPNLPDNQIDPKFWGEFLLIYKAIQNLLTGVSRWSGIDDPDTVEVATTDPASYLLGANLQRYYPRAVVNVFRGQIVRLRPDVGAHWCSPAQATSAVGAAFGVANSDAAPGATVEVIAGGYALTDAIGGMVPGTLYYLSTVIGAIQNLRPVNPGEIIQPVGWAITSTQMLLAVSPYYEQL
jgi:hypothetical protein